MLERALSIFENQYGPEDLKVVETLGYLAMSNTALGNYDKAKDLVKRCSSTLEKQHVREGIKYANLLLSLGITYGGLNDYQKQRDIFFCKNIHILLLR